MNCTAVDPESILGWNASPSQRITHTIVHRDFSDDATTGMLLGGARKPENPVEPQDGTEEPGFTLPHHYK